VSRTRVVVYDSGALVHVQESAVDSEVLTNGALKILGGRSGVLFARGHWSKVTTELIED
jgi:hypothetical protein